jgi:hypothetical protein
MLSANVTLLLLVGGWGAGDLERALDGAHRAAARDLLEALTGAGAVARAVVATDDPEWAATLADLPVEVDLDAPDEPFHFGRRLAGLIERYGARRVLSPTAGRCPLGRDSGTAGCLGAAGDHEQCPFL